MKTTPKTFLVMCRRMWAARERRDALQRQADADKLERIITELILS